jgi:carboxyl-terminal processing protease
MSRVAKIAVITLSLVVFSYVGLGYVLGQTDNDNSYRSLTVYGEVLQHIQEDYVDQPNIPLVTAGALHGLLESLDPYSGYLSPREYTAYQEKLKQHPRGQVGVALAKRFGYIIVVSVLPDGPAEKASLRRGDILEAIAGFTTRDMSVEQANVLLEGAPGTTVKVAVVRRGSTDLHEIEVSRAVIATPPLMATRLAGNVGYIRLPALDAGVADSLRGKLREFQRQGVHKLVLDLRGCASGPVSEGIAAAELFVPSGTITVLKGQTVSRQQFDAVPAKVVWKDPVEVLISDNTAGAAEVLASALGDNHLGDLVGARTFGAASEQKLIPLDDGSALLLTVAYYYTPKGKSILEDGVEPNVQVAAVLPDTTAQDTLEAPPPPSLTQPPSLNDPVLRKALDRLQSSAHKAA